jgi:hypothetical protein
LGWDSEQQRAELERYKGEVERVFGIESGK